MTYQNLTRLPTTCSMLELTGGYTILEDVSHDDFHYHITRYREMHINDHGYGKPRAIIANVNRNFNWFERMQIRKRLGFKRIAKYRGNSGMVYVYLCKL